MNPGSTPPDLAQWGLHCFCLGARSTPHQVVRLDDNGKLLFQAVGGIALETLSRRGIEPTESQIWLLAAYELIERQGTRLETSFPVIGPEAAGSVRRVAEAAASAAMDEVAGIASRIDHELDSAGLPGYAFSVVFGHGLDGVFWDVLRRRGGMPEVTPNVAHPFWRGTFWAVYPGRENASGTNELVGDGAVLVMVWDEGSIDSLRALASRIQTVDSISAIGTGTGGLFIPGVGDVPVINRENPAHVLSFDMALAVAHHVPTPPECHSVMKDAGVQATEEEAIVIVAHEVIWSVTDQLAAARVVKLPDGTGPEGRVFVRIEG